MEFTDKTQEYLSAAVQLARENGHIDLRPAHLALVLFEDNDGLAVQGVLGLVTGIGVRWS